MQKITKYFFLAVLIAVSVTVKAQNYVTTYSGGTGPGFKNGQVDTAMFNSPFGMCRDKSNNLYVVDAQNNCIRKIDLATGTVSTLAGSGIAGWKDGNADSARFYSPADVCVDDSGNVYVSDFTNQRIRKITVTGQVITVAGNGTEGYKNGNAGTAEFDYPRGICMDANRNLYVADSWNHRIRKITPTGVVSTYAGGGASKGVASTGDYVDANDSIARFYTPSGLAIDAQGNIYVADAYNHRIRKISISQAVTTVAGNGATGPNNGGFKDGAKPVAILNTPTEVFVDEKHGILYFSDTFNDQVRKINVLNGDVSTVAGKGWEGYDDGIDSLATFAVPRGLVMDTSGGKIYVTDFMNNAIRLITLGNVDGIEEAKWGGNILLFPNPSEGVFTISNLPKDVKQVEIFDVLGNKIKEMKMNGQPSLNINLTAFAKGMYLLKIVSSAGNPVARKVLID